MLVSLHLLLFCRLHVAHFLVELMNQAVVLLLKNQHIKLIIWGTSQGRILMQVNFLDSNSSNITTSNKISGGLTLVINSSKTRVDHQIGCHNKGLTFMRGQQSWRRLLLNSCRFQCQITRVLSQPLKIWRSRWDN